MGKSIAIFGTASNTGKTTLSIALCRYFTDLGLKVFPFKAFNLSGNSFILNGFEIGYAQYIQSIACKREYDISMNPVLKKYENHSMKYIINGKEENITCENTIQYMKDVSNAAYKKALSENDLVIVEGSGSCCELNLNHLDVGNMSFAHENNIPIILVGDISNGGIFANLYGTINLLEPEKSQLIKALIINKLHGDTSLFIEGKKIIEKICQREILTLMPYMDLNFPEEDDSLNNNKKINNNIDSNIIESEIKKLVSCFIENTNLDLMKKIIN